MIYILTLFAFTAGLLLGLNLLLVEKIKHKEELKELQETIDEILYVVHRI